MAAAQVDLFEDHASAPDLPPPDVIRTRLRSLLAVAQNASRMPWDIQRAQVNAHLFHNMANWLPEPERDALRAAFSKELERLRAVG